MQVPNMKVFDTVVLKYKSINLEAKNIKKILIQSKALENLDD